MILTDFLESTPDLQWRYAKQAGVNHGVIRLPESPEFDLADCGAWRTLCGRFESYGIRPLVIEPLPNRLHDAIKAGTADRDRNIETLIRMFAVMDQMDIRILCLNFMAHVGWYRSRSDYPERGGALSTAFDLEEYRGGDAAITERQLWENLTYFLKAVVPYAERYHIRLALHPDDPPVPRLGNVSRILISLANIDKAVHLVESPYLGVTMCQATYSAMGEDVFECIRHFSRQEKLFFVHFRDIVGDRYRFHETFHDNGQTDMAQAVRTYRDCGYEGPVRVDHVPTMAGESNDRPGYASIGRLFAIGYLKGLLDGCGCSCE